MTMKNSFHRLGEALLDMEPVADNLECIRCSQASSQSILAKRSSHN